MSNENQSAEERWLPVAGFDGAYEVSNLGRVRSLARTIIRSNGRPLTIQRRILRPTTNPENGYLAVSLWRDNIGTSWSVHALVAKAFVPNPENLPEIDHEDRNPANPSASNLRWSTRSGNLMNQRQISRGRSGIIGVEFHHECRKPWAVFVANKFLGRYATREEAASARATAHSQKLEHSFL